MDKVERRKRNKERKDKTKRKKDKNQEEERGGVFIFYMYKLPINRQRGRYVIFRVQEFFFSDTEDAAGDLTAGSETTSEGSGGVQVTNTNLDLKSGITIYGRYTEIDVNAGQIIAYIGKA